MKKLFCLILTFIITVIPLGINASAASGNGDAGIMPAFDYISDAGCTLYITETGKATFNSNINGNRDEVLMIEIYVKLQKKNGSSWKDIATNSAVFYDDFGSCDGVYYLTDAGVYRTETTFTVYTADDLETITSYSSEVTY